MDTLDCIKTRQSIRRFKPDQIPKETLMELIENAHWSPSYKNTQPWEVVILSGQKKKEVSELMIRLFEAGTPPSPDLETPTSWPEAEQARIQHLLAARAEATGIDLNDPEIIKKSKKANFNFYHAPHAIYLLQDRSLNSWSFVDLGLFAQTLMLAAHAMGLATVPQAFTTDFAGEIKAFLNIPASKRLVLGLSVGYPDMDSPVNAMKTDRSDIEEIVSWLE